MATSTPVVTRTYHAGKRLWQVLQRVLVQRAGRSQLRQVITAFVTRLAVLFQVAASYFLVTAAGGFTMVHKGQ